VFYANYLWLVDKFLFDKQIGKFIVSNILLVAVCVIVLHIQQRYTGPTMHHHPDKMGGPPTFFFVFRDITSMLLSSGISVAIRMTGQWYKVESVRKETEKDRYETELKNLKNQLNPHFLFNTLNNIYSLIPVHPEQAQETVHGLSHLLRYVLYENNSAFVPLDKELSFLQSYIDLMSLRLTDQVELTTDIESADGADLIAPMLFISLIENAFKHGISSSQPSFIHIQISVEQGKEVICTVENSYFPKSETDKSGSGIGHKNLVKRLNLLYPQKHKLVVENRDKSYFAQLTIYF
jgi:LytS/YehU family sensor histidine kinase